MRSPCANLECSYQDTGECARRTEFPDPEAQCIDLRRGRGVSGMVPAPVPPINQELEPTPDCSSPSNDPFRFWSGLALGSEEAAALLWNPQTKLITIAGERDSGKTCLLTALYIQMANGFTNDIPYRFAGSHTLRGFQALSDKAFQWQGGETRILPRTTQSNHRNASFLHLSLGDLKTKNTLPWHLLLTDMPGEWFQNWIGHGQTSFRDALEFMPRSDGFVLTVDVHRLNQDRIYRRNQSYLITRIATLLRESQIHRRPVALVLTKFDRLPKDAVRAIPPPGERLDAGRWGSLQNSIRPLLEQLHDLPTQTPRAVFPCAAFARPSGQPLGVFEPFVFVLKYATVHYPIVPSEPPIREFKDPKRSRYFMMFQEGGAND